MKTFADRYQSVLVPVIFEPWADELLRRASPASGEYVLDLACGTGVVARRISSAVPKLPGLVGVDHSAEMLSVARDLAEEYDLQAEWIEADAGDLPFDKGQFDIAFCQQALQFFPDGPAALRELRRVLRPGGRIAGQPRASASRRWTVRRPHRAGPRGWRRLDRVDHPRGRLGTCADRRARGAAAARECHA